MHTILEYTKTTAKNYQHFIEIKTFRPSKKKSTNSF